MHLIFKNPGIDYMLDSIMEFQSDELTPFWFNSLYYFYPQLDKQYSKSLSFAKRNGYIKDTLKSLYKDLEKNLDQKLIDYSLYWNSHEKQITDAFSDAFQMDCSALFPDLCCYISMNPISPRFLREKSFEVFYMNSEKGAAGLALHEVNNPAASNGASILQRCRAAGYVTLAAFAKCSCKHGTWLFFVKYFSLKKALEFPVFIKGFSLLSAGIDQASLRMRACSIR